MNIFVLDENPTIAAQMHADKHVVKMVLESAQMLCTTHRYFNSLHPIFYRKTHINHPCNVWLRSSSEAYDWLYSLFAALCEEFTFRRNKTHLCETKFIPLLKVRPYGIPKVPMPERPQCMPDEYKVPGDPVQAYKNYYLNEKAHLLQYDWGRPGWM